MAIFDLYEINTVDVFDTAKYRAVSANDPYSGALLANRKAKAHSIYAQLYVAPEPEDLRPLLNCDWLRVDRFNTVDTSADGICDYLDAGESERILLAGAKASSARGADQGRAEACLEQADVHGAVGVGGEACDLRYRDAAREAVRQGRVRAIDVRRIPRVSVAG